MAAIDNAEYRGDLSQIAGVTDQSIVKELVINLFWKMMRDHWNQSVKTKAFGFLPISIKLEKVRPVLEAILGPDPYR